MSTLGREETERLMAHIKREREANDRRTVRAHLDAWRIELEDRRWRAHASIAVGSRGYDHATLQAEISAFAAVVADIAKGGDVE